MANKRGNNFKNIVGQKFGRLTVVGLDEKRMKEHREKTGKSLAYWWCQCDCGSNELVSIMGSLLITGITKSCGCLNKESVRKIAKLKAINGNSVGQYILDTYGENGLNDYWDYEKNNKLGLNPFEINKGNNLINIWIKCQEKDYHDSYLITANNFIRGQKCPYCASKRVHYLDSFAQWGIDNICSDFLKKYWDYEKNKGINPWELSIKNIQDIWIKCQNKPYHENYLTNTARCTKGSRCPYCNGKKLHLLDSFAYYHINNTDKDFLEKYWDYSKNIDKNGNPIDPWKIAVNSHKNIWIKCQNSDKPYHKSYETRCDKFSRGCRCPYCVGKKVHIFDSFAYYHINNTDKDFFNKYWDWEKNEELGINPWEITPIGDKKVWIKCENNDKHPSYYVATKDFTRNHRCPICRKSKGERKIRDILNLSDICFIPQMGFDGLVGLGNRNLSYDFYLEKYNLLIEYQGEFHDGKTTLQNEEQFKIQQEHDRRKKEYANNNDIKLLEIWYWDYNNIQQILEKELKIKN